MKLILIFLSISIVTSTSFGQNCSSTRDYEIGLKNGLRMAPPCELMSAKLPKCIGEYDAKSWSSCYGERIFSIGGSYRGGYLDGKANGKGEFVNPEGTRYLGDYVKGQRNGYGKEYTSDGNVLKEGQWSSGVLVSDQKINQGSPIDYRGSKFNIPDGSAYVCNNKRTDVMLIELMYSRTSDELASVIVYSPTMRIDKVLTWVYISTKNGANDTEYKYKNTNINSTILTIFPNKSDVSIKGDSGSLEFVNCLMVSK